MRVIEALLILAISSTLSCAMLTSGDTAPSMRLRAIDGLERVEIPMPGVLELREDHRIGGYDAFVIPDASLSYKRGSSRLTRDAERVFLKLLKESLIEASEAAVVPIEQEPGACVMEISLTVSRMDLDVGIRADQLAELTLIMQFRDSVSRDPLLRYATVNRVPNPSEGATHDRQIRRGLDRIVKEMDISRAFRSAGLADDTIIPGCKGTLADRGRAALEQQ